MLYEIEMSPDMPDMSIRSIRYMWLAYLGRWSRARVHAERRRHVVIVGVIPATHASIPRVRRAFGSSVIATR